LISTNDFRTGVTIEYDGAVYTVVDFQHVKPGKGSAFVRTRLKNVRTGAVLERTFSAGEKLTRAHVERRECQYLYSSGNDYFVMDAQTFEQSSLTREQIGDAVDFLKENMPVWLLTYESATLGVEIPNFVDLIVAETDPGFRGDTATGGSKPAKLETGAVIKVPLFVDKGDKIKVDTRTRTYIERV
jgi:elongation factor P